jgi:hypothetical protein
MSEKGAEHHSPLILQLVKNREEQRTADAQKDSEKRGHDLEFFPRQPMEGIDFGPLMEWVRMFFSVFWLSLLSGSFLFVWVFALKLAGF